MKRAAALITAGVAVAILAGCNDTTEGSAQPVASGESTAEQGTTGDPFDVCALDDSVVTQANLDPGTKRVVTNATEPTSFRVCAWTPADEQFGTNYRVSLFSTTHTLDEVRTKASVDVLGETTVNGRAGLTTKEQGDPDGCYVDFEASQGAFTVRAALLSDYEPQEGDLCEIAAEHAELFEPNLPE